MPIEFEEYLFDLLPDLDAVLAKRGIGLSERPVRASMLVVEHCIVEVKGDTKEGFLMKPWFGALFRSVRGWYENRYGSALEQRPSGTVSAVISAFGTPFLAEVPLLVSEPPLPDKTFWLRFPIQVDADEDHMSWMVNPPNFDASTEQERMAASEALVIAATYLRRIHVNLVTAKHESERAQSLAQGILSHLEKGAIDIVRAKASSTSIAVWELNFACERAAKTYLIHHGVKPPRTHDLRRLHHSARDFMSSTDLDDAIDLFPPEKEVIEHRYSEIPSPSRTKVLAMYSAALKICEAYSAGLSRNFTFNNAKVQLKLPPWLGLFQDASEEAIDEIDSGMQP